MLNFQSCSTATVTVVFIRIESSSVLEKEIVFDFFENLANLTFCILLSFLYVSNTPRTAQ